MQGPTPLMEIRHRHTHSHRVGIYRNARLLVSFHSAVEMLYYHDVHKMRRYDRKTKAQFSLLVRSNYKRESLIGLKLWSWSMSRWYAVAVRSQSLIGFRGIFRRVFPQPNNPSASPISLDSLWIGNLL